MDMFAYFGFVFITFSHFVNILISEIFVGTDIFEFPGGKQVVVKNT